VAARQVPAHWNALVEEVRSAISEGQGINTVIKSVFARANGVIGTEWVMLHALNIDLRRTRELVEESSALTTRDDYEPPTSWYQLVESIGLVP
jgi:hypothetical protein